MSSQDFIIDNIVKELKQIPEEYLENLYEIVSVFRKNISQPNPTPEDLEASRKIWEALIKEAQEQRNRDGLRKDSLEELW